MVVAPVEQIRSSADAEVVPVVNWCEITKDSSIANDYVARACEVFGFFKLTNFAFPESVDVNLDALAVEFFSQKQEQKQHCRPPAVLDGAGDRGLMMMNASYPFGYGMKNIGFRGDSGELEYLLLPTNTESVAEVSTAIFKNDPQRFTKAVNRYVQCMSSLATQLLHTLSQGLQISTTTTASSSNESSSFAEYLNQIRQPDSLLRFNHYPPLATTTSSKSNAANNTSDNNDIGFGEHTDPQLLTILRSDDVPGLQIQTAGGAWVAVPPDPHALFVFVGDTVQALTNGRIKSVRHRVMANSYSCSRLSYAFFAAPGLKQVISPNMNMTTPQNPRLYKSYTWEEYKRVMYTLRLSDNRLDLFRVDEQDLKK